MANITKVSLLSVPLEKDYAHTLYFADAEAQNTYFSSKKKKSYTDFSYQRKDNVIRVPEHIDTLYSAGCNYVMYQNTAYSSKWFYAFITNMEYVDDGRTDVYIQTDCIQTWMFDIRINASFVEREHSTNDAIGANTIDEGLETGEYVCDYMGKDSHLQEYKYVIMVTDYLGDNTPYAVNMGGIFYAGGAYICSTMGEVVSIVNALANEGKSEAVTAVYMLPQQLILDQTEDMQFSGQTAPATYDLTIAKPTSINAYIPKNNKLFTFPYQYLLVSNNSGTSNVLKYEYFKHPTDTDNVHFKVYGVPVVGGSIKLSPQYYKGVTDNQEEGIMCGKFPTLSWSADLFTNWLTQNSVNIGIGVATGAVQIVGGVATMIATSGAGAALGGAGIVGGVSTIANTLSQVHQQSFTPNSAKGNTNGGDINTATKNNTFFFYRMNIKQEYARQIDEYFTMFGYKCNRVKVPAKDHREMFWFTKTIDANIQGNIPQEDLQTIKDCYNRGITFWRRESGVNFRNYNVSNNIV